jgi:hypothetical protein
MRNYLRATSAAEGKDPDSGVYRLIENLVLSTSRITSETSVQYDAQQSKFAMDESGSRSDDSNMISGNQTIAILNGQGQKSEYIMNQGTNYTFVANGNAWSNLLTSGDKAQPMGGSMTLRKAFEQSAFNGAIDPGSVYFGE